MTIRIGLFALAGLGLAAAMAAPSSPLVPKAYAACDPGDKIDKSTADDARKRLAAAGYKQITELKKACDNFWHATVIKDGAEVYLALPPQGDILTETAR